MEKFRLKNKISNICTLAAIPGSIAWIIGLLGLGANWFYDVADVAGFNMHLMSAKIDETIIVMCFVLYGISLLALIVSTFTCGTLGRMFMAAGRGFLGVIRAPRIIILTITFFVVWLYVASLVFAAVFASGFLCPAGAIAICAKHKRKEVGYESYTGLCNA